MANDDNDVSFKKGLVNFRQNLQGVGLGILQIKDTLILLFNR